MILDNTDTIEVRQREETLDLMVMSSLMNSGFRDSLSEHTGALADGMTRNL